MFSVFSTLKLSLRSFQRVTQRLPMIERPFTCNYSDKATSDQSKQLVQGTENDQKLRVRRAHPYDVPRVLRFVHEHCNSAWPGVAGADFVGPYLVLDDYVSRIMAQGHSLLVEQHEARRGWTTLCGLALTNVVAPWDAALLDRWSQCVQCNKSKRLIAFKAHCLRGPGLHEKYNLNKIMQVVMIVPPSMDKSNDIVNILTKNVIQRGRDIGLPLLRFDVTNELQVRTMEDCLKLKKEWQFHYDVLQQVNAAEPKVNIKKSKIEEKPEEMTSTVKEVTLDTSTRGHGQSECIQVDPTTIPQYQNTPEAHRAEEVEKKNFIAVYSLDTSGAMENQKEVDQKQPQ